MPTQYHVAFWNIENLFDIENSPRRTEKLARALKNSIRGWTQALLDRKISQLSTIIRGMNAGKGPDLIGICEVENQFVVDVLVQSLAPLGRNYKVVHHDTQDNRGIDVAFIYDAGLFQAEEVFGHFVMKRFATRDLVQVNFRTVGRQRPLVIVGNHWPSRSGGEAESAAYRAMAGETLAYFHERILEVKGDDTPVLALGDFNDEPFDASVADYALGTRTADKVISGRNPYFLNLMWPLLGKGLGSLYFDGPNLLDQILVNKNFLRPAAAFKIKANSVKILRPAAMTNPNNESPVPFGGMGKPVNQNGFSDHFPVEVVIVEAD